jgi:glycosyltransferase involved in cell wall biosynthesis
VESISVFFPAYNDCATIGTLVEKTFQLLKPSGRDFEIIVVDDGSSDATPQLLAELEKKYAGVFRTVRHAINGGYGAALRTGFAAATKDLVFYTDGDGQYDPDELALLLPRMQPHIGLVNGYKIKRHDPLHRVLIGKIYNLTIRLFFGFAVKDVDCDFRLIRRSLLQKATLTANTGAICVELLVELTALQCNVENVPVHHYPRVAGQSQFFRLRSVFATLDQLGSLYFRKRYALRSADGLLEPNPK